MAEIQTSKCADDGAHFEVVVVGAGLAGLAACIHLARLGFTVGCIEPGPIPHKRLGESLDWSTPGLLRTLGVDPQELVAEEIAVSKSGVQICLPNKRPWTVKPASWLGRKPFGIELTTLNVDRLGLDNRLCEMARRLDVTFLNQKVTSLVVAGERVRSCVTSTGQNVAADWFIDATGRSRLFARTMGISKQEYGRRKVCSWAYFECPPTADAVTLYADFESDYLTWIWDIPITPTAASVGLVISAERLKELRQGETELKRVFFHELAKYPRFASLLERESGTRVSTVSYRSYVHERVCGENWLMVGEAASAPDPITANGVTAALRHAQDAASVIDRGRSRGVISRQDERNYNAKVVNMGHAFNRSVETVVYSWPARRGLGLLAAKIYIGFAWPANALFSRFRPTTSVSIAMFSGLLRCVPPWMTAWAAIGRLAFSVRRRGLFGGRSS